MCLLTASLASIHMTPLFRGNSGPCPDARLVVHAYSCSLYFRSLPVFTWRALTLRFQRLKAACVSQSVRRNSVSPPTFTRDVITLPYTQEAHVRGARGTTEQWEWQPTFITDVFIRTCACQKNKQSYLRRLKQWLMYLYVVFAIQKLRHGLSMQMAIWVFCELSPPIIIAPQAGIRDGLIALQALLKNRASFLASQAIRSTFSTQITPVPSTLLCARSKNKERGICWMSVQLSASVALQPDALKTGRTIHPSQSTDP